MKSIVDMTFWERLKLKAMMLKNANSILKYMKSHKDTYYKSKINTLVTDKYTGMMYKIHVVGGVRLNERAKADLGMFYFDPGKDESVTIYKILGNPQKENADNLLAFNEVIIRDESPKMQINSIMFGLGALREMYIKEDEVKDFNEDQIKPYRIFKI